MSTRSSRAYIGTSGWDYPHWRERFYPKDLRQADWLEHLSRRLGTVEVNNSFYRVPDRRIVEEWEAEAPSGFRFAVKMWRGVTHFKKLKDCRHHLERFFAPVSVLATRARGPVLVQLPAQQGRDLAKLERFLDALKSVTHPDRWKIAVEFRHPDWLCREAYELLDRQQAAICLHDMPPCHVTEPNEARFVYVRRHGPEGDYQRAYSRRDIRKDARAVRAWLDDGRTVFVYFNNDGRGHAPRNAGELRAAVDELE